MKFLLPLFCFLNLSLMSQDNYIEESLERWQNAQTYTIDVIESIPDTGFSFRPTVGQMTVEEQLLHLLKNMNWLTGSYLEGAETVFDFNSIGNDKAQIINLANTVFNNANNALLRLPISKLSEKVEFFAGPKTRSQIIQLIDDHHTHHRAQLIVYLRLMGIKPPRYIGW